MKVALHTAEVEVGGDQSENEATYGGYARATLQENGWATFPPCESGEGQFYTHASLAEDNGEIVEIIELTPPTLGQLGASPSFIVPESA